MQACSGCKILSIYVDSKKYYIDYYSTSESEAAAEHSIDTPTETYHPSGDIQNTLSQVYMSLLCVYMHKSFGLVNNDSKALVQVRPV